MPCVAPECMDGVTLTFDIFHKVNAYPSLILYLLMLTEVLFVRLENWALISSNESNFFLHRQNFAKSEQAGSEQKKGARLFKK